ncbi:protein SAWADEE HOMEODOMAIN HOMOLOG 1-like [Euphorbia lathyris]|uniref:protein SAWADEE HOMEODOMAIN HOMOLOG 1-like n=1 Tax=Euphorbia lathyris TaxID=212925 RepID=UPI003313DA7F
MDRLRPRQRLVFSGFTKAEVEKMENLLKESKQLMNKDFFQKVARSFNHSSGRAGKPVIKWTEVENWFQKRQNDCPSKVDSSKGDEAPDLSELEFEARSSKDGAWYDVDTFLSHRFLPSGEAEVHVRFVGFGAEEDEWVNIKSAVRERSVPLEHSECKNVQIGDLVCCFQERRDQAIYYDAHVIEIEKRVHDIRGCRCLFSIRYDHDNTEERVRLRRLCRRPTN